MFCGGTLVVDVRVICGEGVWEVAYVIEMRRVVVKLFYWQGKVVN